MVDTSPVVFITGEVTTQEETTINRTMSYEEVKLARRIIGLRGTSFTATKNYWRWAVNRASLDQNALGNLLEKGHVVRIADEGREYKLTPQGIQQLKQQIGEFTCRID